MVAAAETHPRHFRPGAGYEYSNVNYQIAVMVLEAATGQRASTLLDDVVAGPPR